MRNTIPAACLLALLATAWCVEVKGQADEVADQPQAEQRAEIARLQAELAERSAELRRLEELYKRRAVSLDEVKRAEARAAETQVQLARLRGDRQQLTEQLRSVVSLRELQLRRVEKLVDVGAASRQELLAARGELAEAEAALAETGDDRRKLLSALEALVAARQAQLDYMAAAALPPPRTGEAEAALRAAKIRLAQAQGNHAAVVAQLAAQVQAAEREFQRTSKLYRAGAVSKQALDQAETALEKARKRLAEARGRGPGSSDSSDSGASAGPAAPAPFLGVPHDESRKIDDRKSPLFGVPKMTKVETAGYARYLSLKASGRITAEERRGEFVYFAIDGTLHVPLGGAEAYVDVVERYRAPLPAGAAPGAASRSP